MVLPVNRHSASSRRGTRCTYTSRRSHRAHALITTLTMLTALRPTLSAARLNAVRTMAAGAKFAPYDWQDPLKMQGLLTDEELAIHETARNYAQEKLVPRVLKGWRTVSWTGLHLQADSAGGARPEHSQGDGRARSAGPYHPGLRLRGHQLCVVRTDHARDREVSKRRGYC